MKAPYPWQQTQWQQLNQRRQSQTMPHALLLHGPEGIGKTDFALSMAASLLCERPSEQGTSCGQCKSCSLLASRTHPDFTHIEPEEAGKAIKIDQIREFIGQMGLSSHFGRRVVLISSAEQLNLSAANSLLKTLEEPQPDTVIMLVTSSISRLPATIRSRCQMLRFAMPETGLALEWLRTVPAIQQPEVLLSAANGAPLRAVQMAEKSVPKLREGLLQDLLDIQSGRHQAIAVAASWYRLSDINALDNLYHWICDMIRAHAAGQDYVRDKEAAGQLQSLLKTIDLAKLYQFYDQVSEANRLQATSANSQLLLEGVLISWSYLFKPDQQRKSA